jgi:CheY-like chemotaxis protein
LNHHVGIASGGKQGVEMFRKAARENQSYEVVVTDLGMPDIDGRQVAKSIKKEFPNTPVIMITGWGQIMKEDGEAPPGVDALVGKPPRIRELNELLLRVTARG